MNTIPGRLFFVENYYDIIIVSVYIGYDQSEASIDDNETHESEMWTQESNCGGLVQIDDSLYQLLVAIEIEFRKHFTVANGTANESLKHLAFHGIIENEDVLFYWSMISINWASKEADDLLKMISSRALYNS